MKSPALSPASESKACAWDRPWMIALGALLLAGCLLVAYHNSFRVPFLLDDDDSIAKNPSIRSMATALFPPSNSGYTVSGRPLLNLSLAINYRFGGTNVFGYHVGNLLIHFAAALCLFGIVRRTLKVPRLADRFGEHATPLAWLISALWALHPMQTESVTYIVQRAESLVGFFYLLTLYAFVRSVEKPCRLWPSLACLACLLGMASKEVMASAPILVFLYDRTFVSGTFRESWRRHRWLHLSLASCWLLLLVLVIASGGRGSTVGFSAVTWLDYVLTQGPGITTYVAHSIFPANLVFDYGAIVEKRTLIVLGGLLTVGVLLAGTILLLNKRPAPGYIGAWFFLILAPSSSVIPVATQTLAEHRMYLPLAAIVLAVAILVHRFCGRLRWWILPALIVAAGAVTIARNNDYRSSLALWEDTVLKVPDNIRALNNLGVYNTAAGRLDEAIRVLRETIDLAPRYGEAHANLGNALLRKGLNQSADGKATGKHIEQAPLFANQKGEQRDQALLKEGFAMLRKAIELEPTKASFHSLLGNALMDDRQFEASLPMYEKALSLAPDEPVHHFNYANALSELDRHEEAERHYVLALHRGLKEVDVLTNYGVLLRRMKRLPESLVQLHAAAKLKPDSARVHSNLGVSLIASGETDAGIRELTEALRLQADLPQARYNLGQALAEIGRTEEAIVHMEALLKIARPTAELHSNLGVLYARAGRLEDAIAQMRRALELDPNHDAARENLAKIATYLRSLPGR